MKDGREERGEERRKEGRKRQIKKKIYGHGEGRATQSHCLRSSAGCKARPLRLAELHWGACHGRLQHFFLPTPQGTVPITALVPQGIHILVWLDLENIITIMYSAKKLISLDS